MRLKFMENWKYKIRRRNVNTPVCDEPLNIVVQMDLSI